MHRFDILLKGGPYRNRRTTHHSNMFFALEHMTGHGRNLRKKLDTHECLSENIYFEDYHHGSSSNYVAVQTYVNDLTGNLIDYNMQTGNFTIIFPSLNLKEKLR